MFTIKIDGKEADIYQFKDLRKGEFFASDNCVFIKCHESICGWNAINLKTKCSIQIAHETIVDPILIEWENEDDVL